MFLIGIFGENYGYRPTVVEMDEARFLEECQVLVQAAIHNVSLIFSPVVTVAAVRELTGESAPSDWVGFPFRLPLLNRM